MNWSLYLYNFFRVCNHFIPIRYCSNILIIPELWFGGFSVFSLLGVVMLLVLLSEQFYLWVCDPLQLKPKKAFFDANRSTCLRFPVFWTETDNWFRLTLHVLIGFSPTVWRCTETWSGVKSSELREDKSCMETRRCWVLSSVSLNVCVATFQPLTRPPELQDTWDVWRSFPEETFQKVTCCSLMSNYSLLHVYTRILWQQSCLDLNKDSCRWKKWFSLSSLISLGEFGLELLHYGEVIAVHWCYVIFEQ